MASYEFFRDFRESPADDALTGKTDSYPVSGLQGKRSFPKARQVPKGQGSLDGKTGCDSPVNRRSRDEEKTASRSDLQACATLPFFGPGTMVKTPNGEVPVELLNTSDQVLTRDHGFQSILWAGQTAFPARFFAENPKLCPVVIPPAALDANCPARPLCVSSRHRILLRSQVAELTFLSSEVFVDARAWVQAGKAERLEPDKTLKVTHILLASHQIILANGVWVETMLATPDMLRLFDHAEKERVEETVAEEIYTQQTARPCLTRKEAMMLIREKASQNPVDDRQVAVRRCVNPQETGRAGSASPLNSRHDTAANVPARLRECLPLPGNPPGNRTDRHHR